LFLDELGELPPAAQANLLRALEQGEIEPVGANRPVKVNVRVIAATNRSLRAMIAEGTFREDLYQRFGLTVRIPALRERGDDLRELLDTFIDLQAREESCRPITIPQGTLELLLAYSWPGNVRELRNLVERLTILYPGQLIRRQHLPAEFHAVSVPQGDNDQSTASSLNHHLKCAERQLVLKALEKTGGRKGQAAEQLGLSRHAFKRRLQRLGIT
jgi:DNA-binding NtrC family response regulator